jgi:ADP-ribose pyrophosphatase YjhB (NUDIX family)
MENTQPITPATPYTFKGTIGCCVIVQNEKGHILLAKRKNSYKAGFFGLPGGRVEGNELLTDCALRELREETSLHAVHLQYIGVVREWQPDFPGEHPDSFVHFVFLCKEWEGAPTTNEPDRAELWEWYDINNLPDPVVPGHFAGLKLLASNETVQDLV